VEEPRWLSKKAVLAIHSEQLSEHGGSTGIRDETLLDSALGKPQNVWACADDPTLFRLAACYAYGIARNHAFVDGNQRTALVVSLTFLKLNGCEIVAPKQDFYFKFLDLADRSLSEEELTEWLTINGNPL
jgi:death-on-curing protein